MKKCFVTAAMVCAIGLQSVEAQRHIASFRESKITYGSSYTIDGVKQTEPDIYYVDKGDGTYEAVRLTVAPKDEKAAVTLPYLNLDTPTSIRVNWKTNSKAEGSVVRFGSAPDKLDRTAQATFRAITTDYYWNMATLEGLAPNTVYYYQVSTNGVDSEIYRFRTMPVAGDKGKMRVLFIGDHQRNEHSDYEWLLSAARWKVAEKYGDAPFEDNIRFLMNVGDQVDRGTVDLYENVHLYKSRSVSPVLPNMTAVGNHEYKGDESLTVYDRHFREYGQLEYQGIASGTSQYYAYQAGSVLFVVLNSDAPTTAQKMWVRKVAAAAASDDTVDFIVSVQHRPLYAEQYTYDVSDWMRNEIMPILSATPKHVLNCAGHHHLYARGQMTDTPVYHMISGGGVGTSAEGYEQLWGTTPDNLNREEVQKTLDQWTYQIFEFDPENKEMTVETYSIGNSRLALDNELVDRFTRKVDSTGGAPAPELQIAGEPVGLPYTVTQKDGAEDLYVTQWQIARDDKFADILLDKVVTAEDCYGAQDDFRPLDLNKDKDISEYRLEAGALANGTYYVRVRNRNSNLDWSEYSLPAMLTVEGSVEPAAVELDAQFYRTGSTVHLTYEGAPLGTDAWVGYYKEHHKPGTADQSVAYEYTSAASGTWDFTVNTPGAYFAVLFKDGGYSEACERKYFVVSDNCDDSNRPYIETDKRVYEVGDPVVVSLHDAPCIVNDWAGLYDISVVSPVNGKSHSYAYAGSDPEGEVTLNVAGNMNYTKPVGDGLYYVSYFISDQYYEPVERVDIVVGKPVVIDTDKKSYDLTDKVHVVYEGAPMWDADRLQLYSGESLLGEYPVSERGGAIEIGSLPAGDYAICMATDGDALISERIGFTVKDVSSVVTPDVEDGCIVSVQGNTVRIVSDAALENVAVYALDGRCVATPAAAGLREVSFSVQAPQGVYMLAVNGRAAGKLVIR